MADKEERIYIGIIDPKGDFCPVPYGTCNSLCDNCKGGMTRQEAIRKMAETLCHKHCTSEDCTGCDHWDKYQSIEDAEAALNALLQKEK